MQWSDFSQINLRRALEEREASQRLRGLISNTLSRTSADMREQADRVEEALSRRVAETEEATRNVEIELKEVMQDFMILLILKPGASYCCRI